MEAVLGALFLKNAKIVSATQKSKAIHVSLEKEKKKVLWNALIQISEWCEETKDDNTTAKNLLGKEVRKRFRRFAWCSALLGTQVGLSKIKLAHMQCRSIDSVYFNLWVLSYLLFEWTPHSSWWTM